ncbi:DUF982 domain-containing protein [Rhizobium sp. BK418]|uniref:DUF982 domain-containing protein n=1 Tax=Rhizobium sp. BK418 TaxID=2512120 RepID=UPI001FE0595F|nr:DUF982 domain-containing protein [Rhizobium sp. BK418]
MRERRARSIVQTINGYRRCPIEGRRPDDDSEEYVTAVKSCADAVTGKIGIEEFRQPFLKAASKTNIATFFLASGNAA